MYQLTRLLGRKFQEDIKTGQPEIDTFLLHLDSKLAGSFKVRRITLEEVSDHLLAAQAVGMKGGQSATDAAKQAVNDFGDIELHARLQRKKLYRDFWQTLSLTGGVFALLMTFFYLGNEVMGGNWWVIVSLFVVNFILFGFFMAYLMVFSFASDKLAQSDVSTQSYSTGVIEVESTNKEKRYAIVLCGVMSGLGMLGALGVLGIGIFANVSLLYCLGLIFLGLHNALGACSAWNHYQLTPTHFHIQSMFGCTEIPRHSISMVKKASSLASYAYLGAGVLHWVYWQQTEGSKIRTRRKGLVLNQEMKNVDELLASLHNHVLMERRS